VVRSSFYLTTDLQLLWLISTDWEIMAVDKELGMALRGLLEHHSMILCKGPCSTMKTGARLARGPTELHPGCKAKVLALRSLSVDVWQQNAGNVWT
jgi:hypothetical protein